MIILRILFLLVAAGCLKGTWDFFSQGEMIGGALMLSLAALFIWLFSALGSNHSNKPVKPSMFGLIYIIYGFALFASVVPVPDTISFIIGMSSYLIYLAYMIYRFKIKRDDHEERISLQIHVVTWHAFAVYIGMVPVKIAGYGQPALGFVMFLILLGIGAYYFKHPRKARQALLQPKSILMRVVVPIAALGGGGGMALSKYLLHTNISLAWIVCAVFFFIMAWLFIVLGQAVRLGPLVPQKKKKASRGPVK